jgi:two-component system chemotaxis response regulator CheB
MGLDKTSRCVVIGASWGGVTALQKLCSGLDPDLPAAILVVQHIGANESQLAALLSNAGPLPCHGAEDGMEIQPGALYVAPPDRHMILDGSRIRLTAGPKENHARPAIDPLFRSAAAAYRERCVGVILTGLLDDGTAGLHAIKQCGGLAIVQDPVDAEQAEMPRSAI